MDKLDILNRKEFVGQLVNLVNNISVKKSSTSFALNGEWGCGKTFVLDMFQQELEQIQEQETGTNRFFVIRYDCWKYDYYEEPLVAIVSTMITMIQKKIYLFEDSEEKREILGMLKAVGTTLFSIGSDALKEKIGIDVCKAVETIRKGAEGGRAAFEKEQSYDVYFIFNKVMQRLAELLKKITDKYTVIFLVDELDRCMPEYAIKVLERLHHLTEENTNIITIISFDKKQLMTSIKQIFGYEEDSKYLEKFIQFEIKLDYGKVSDKITEKYEEYVSLFDPDIFPFEESIEECLQAIFQEIDIRTQEQIFKKAMIAHKLLYTEKKDYSFMCMELLLAVLICVYGDNSCFSDTPISGNSFANIFITREQKKRPAFVRFFEIEFEEIKFRYGSTFTGEATSYVLPEKPNLYAVIIYTWYWMHKPNNSFIFQHREGDVYEPIIKNYKALKTYAETIKMMSQ